MSFTSDCIMPSNSTNMLTVDASSPADGMVVPLGRGTVGGSSLPARDGTY